MLRLIWQYTRFRPSLDAFFGGFKAADILRMLPFMPSFFRLRNMSVEQYISRFQDPLLRDVLFQMFPVKNLPAIMMIMPLAYFHNQQGGYPLGGSLAFARAIEKRFLSLGGKVSYGQRVKRVLTEGARAVGIETGDGKQIHADIVVSACDGHATLYQMLRGTDIPPVFSRMYENPSLWPPLVSVSLGVNRDLSGEPEMQSFKLEIPIELCGRNIEWFGFVHFCMDPAFAPKGKSVVETQFETDHAYWEALSGDAEQYHAGKERILNFCIRQLEAIFPGIGEQIEQTDVATPITWVKWTGNWRASYQGWMPHTGLFGKLLPATLTGLKGFYMTGQWIFPGGGVPTCMALARRLIETVCKDENIPFQCKAETAFQ